MVKRFSERIVNIASVAGKEGPQCLDLLPHEKPA